MRRFVLLAVSAVVFAPSVTAAQAAGQGAPAWTFGTRIIVTNISELKGSEGYRLYSGSAAEVRLTRAVGRHFGVEWTASTYSRQADWAGSGWSTGSLGSVEVLPVGIQLQYRPFSVGRFQPYLGAGIAATVFWNMSGEMASVDLTSEVGPVGQVGVDFGMSSRIVLNADFRINWLETDLKYHGAKVDTLTLNPATVGVGISVRF